MAEELRPLCSKIDGIFEPASPPIAQKCCERQAVIAQALQQIGDEMLRPVKEFLGEAYAYDEMKIVRAAAPPSLTHRDHSTTSTLPCKMSRRTEIVRLHQR